jgi:hypothetical protein
LIPGSGRPLPIPANANASPAMLSLCWLKTMLSVKKCVGFGQSLIASVHVKIDNIAISHHKRLMTRPKFQDLRPLKLLIGAKF